MKPLRWNAPGVQAALLSLTLVSTLPIHTASAQSSLVLEEIVITARKRAESLQNAPIAVSAFTGEALKDAGITNLIDVTELVPNLQISRPARDVNIYIRGVGPARGATNVTEPSVGVYLDDVYLLKPTGQLLDLAEVESVQVLRGPQGTLFGKNTTGGAMLVTSKKPSEEFGGYVQITGGNDGRRDAQASIDVPLSDTLLSKLTVTSVKSDGYFQDPVHGTELSDDDRLGALLQLRWLASDDVTADFSVFHNKIRENLLAMGDCAVVNPNSIIANNALITPVTGERQLLDFCEEVNTVHGGRAPYFTNSQGYNLDATQVSMQVNWDINDNHSFKSTTAWRYQETPNLTYTNTYAGFPEAQRAIEEGDSTQLSQEFQFSGELLDGRLRYATGLYYLQDDADTGTRESALGFEGIWGSVTEGVPPGLTAALTQTDRIGQENENETLALFTQWSWDATENLELTAGLRYSSEDRELQTRRARGELPGIAYADVPGAIVIAPDVVLFFLDDFYGNITDALPLAYQPTEILDGKESFDSLTPMFSAAYSFSEGSLPDSIDSLLVYASYTEGYKAGGLSDFALGELIPFEEEEIDNIELGLKMDAWDNRLRLNLAYFMMDYSDQQLFVARPDPTPNAIGTLQGVTNAGQSSIDGLEVELSVLPADGWLIQFSGSYADGEFEEFDDFATDANGVAMIIDRSDESLPSLPETSFSLGVQYEWDTRVGSWLARVDGFFRDEIYWGFDAAAWDIPLARQESTTDSYTIYNARVQWQIAENIAVTFWGKNLGDKVYFDGGVGEATNLGLVNKAFSPPRRYGVDLRYDF